MRLRIHRLLRSIRFWLYQNLIAIDQLINTALPIGGGWADETFSARCWRMSRTSAAWSAVRAMVDAVMFFDPRHCETSYESEQKRMHLPPELRSTEEDSNADDGTAATQS